MLYLKRVLFSVITEVAVVLCVFTVAYRLLLETEEGTFDADPVGAVFQDCKNPCEVLYNPGGVLQRFTRAANALLHGNNERNLVIINGSCYSGCAVFSDLARNRVCITKNALFGFHKGYESHFDFLRGITVVRFDPPQSSDIDRWVRHNGDYPENGVTFMPFSEARKFWSVCDLNPPLPRPDPRKSTAAK